MDMTQKNIQGLHLEQDLIEEARMKDKFVIYSE